MTTRWRAPGRVNLIGEHTDYNDGFVLPLALEMGCVATVEDATSGWTAESAQKPQPVDASEGDLPTWSRYVLGVVSQLRERGVDVPPLRIHVDSDVPEGAGLSSSAALVCSVVGAVQDHLGLGLSIDDMLALSREVENVAVGAPTGGMDQLVSLRGEAGHALLCDMRSLSVEPVPFDPAAAGLALLVVDSRAPHRHVDGEYAARRQACADAARELGVAALRDVPLEGLDDALGRLEDPWRRKVVRHVVTENDRVLRTAELLRAGRLAEIGELLDASHASMRDDFEITVPEVDATWERLKAAGALGARLTGGGFGGCVIALVQADSVEAESVDADEMDPGLGFVATAAAGAGPY